MNKLQELRGKRTKLAGALKTLVDTVEQRDGNMTADEQAEFDRFEKEIQGIDSQIKVEERLRAVLEGQANQGAKPTAAQRARDKAGKTGEEAELRRIAKDYNLLKVVQAKMENRAIDGVEAEMHQEARSEATKAGVAINGIGIPSSLGKLRKPEARDLTAGGSNTGAEFVPTEHRGFIPVLYPRLKTESLGIRILTGLNGNLDIPKQTSRATGAWEGEVDAGAEATPGTDKVSLSPKRYGAFVDFSKQLLVQGSPDVENMVRSDLSRMLAIAADSAVINGSGNGQPTGILQNGDIRLSAYRCHWRSTYLGSHC